MSYSKSDEPYMNRDTSISPALLKLEQDEIEAYAIDLYAIFDPDGCAKWNTDTDKTREYYRLRAKHLISCGYRKQRR